jgi:hypothetical protein
MNESTFVQAVRIAFEEIEEGVRRRYNRLLYLDMKPDKTPAEQAELDAASEWVDDPDW